LSVADRQHRPAVGAAVELEGEQPLAAVDHVVGDPDFVVEQCAGRRRRCVVDRFGAQQPVDAATAVLQVCAEPADQ
jgi:hypothetical protein